ncbi:hypothetical protein BV20DRAFT_238186 [Pilatotrama ljubarskyi]|nr:hypothetical protein BV20DRAFT_238186 [Pilatotrama ljubarskyi]
MAPPPNITIQHVKSPGEELLQEATNIYVDTLQDDPTLVGATAGHLDRAPQIILAVLKPIALVSGEFYAATDENGELVGFTAWVPPGRSTFDTEEQAAMGLNSFMESLHPDARGPYLKTVNEDMPHFIDRAMGMPSAEKACYWCWFAGVKPEYQRKGIFRSMLELVTAKAKAQGATMGVLTSNIRNTELLERLGGFVNKGHTKVNAPWGEWEFWCLAKDTSAS